MFVSVFDGPGSSSLLNALNIRIQGGLEGVFGEDLIVSEAIIYSIVGTFNVVGEGGGESWECGSSFGR